VADEREEELAHRKDAGDEEIFLFADVLKAKSIRDREGKQSMASAMP
jgi:hypothetical protein